MEFTNPIKKSNRKSARTSLLTELFLWDRQRLPLLPSNYYNEEQREVYRVEQPPERGVNDTAREWVSTQSRRISVVDSVSHWTARSHSPYFLFFLTLKPLRNFFLPLRTAQSLSENCCFRVLPLRTAQPSSEDCRFHVLPLRTAQPSSEDCRFHVLPPLLKFL
nr:hypothetical protein Iba_scaffold68769CG0010 [Ipomoea batatas]